MNARITSASSVGSGRRGMVERLGKGGPIGVALVALIIGALVASQTLGHRASPAANQGNPTTRTSKFVEVNTAFMPTVSNAISASESYDDLMAQQDAFFHRTVDTATYYDQLMAQQDQFIGRAATSPVVTSEQQKFLDLNTIWLPAARDAAPSTMSSSQRWFLEVNTTMLPQGESAYPYTESVTPPLGYRR